MLRMPQFALGVFCVVFAVAGWPTQVTAQDIVCDAVGSREIKALQFQGNQAVASSDLEVRILATESSWLRRHAGVLTDQALPGGGRAAPRRAVASRRITSRRAITTPRLRHAFSQRERTWHLAFLIQEGAPIILDLRSRSRGLDSVPHAKQIVAGLGLKVGERVRSFALSGRYRYHHFAPRITMDTPAPTISSVGARSTTTPCARRWRS